MKLLQIWKFGGDSADAASLNQVIERASTSGFDGVLVKALDGTDWMRTYDAAADALASADQVAQQRDRCHAAKLKYYTWTNPLHDVDLERQAALTAEAALASDGLFLDAEPYEGFWGAWRPQGAAARFVEGIRRRAPDVWLALQPDPRPARLAELRPEEWLPHVNALAGQHYWTDFAPNQAAWATRARLELTNAAELGREWKTAVLPTLPGIANPDSVPVELLREFSGFVVFRLGTTSRAMLELLGRIRYEEELVSTPPPAIDPFQGLVTALAYVCDTLGDQLEAAAKTPNGEHETVRAVLGEMRRVREQFVGPRPRPEEVQAPADAGETSATATVLPPGEAEQGSGTAKPRLAYNPATPGLTQPNSWACSVFSATMALNSIGHAVDWLTVRRQMGNAVTEEHGLMDARGPALVQLFETYGLKAGALPWTEHAGRGATWDDVLARVSRMPVLLGGRTWSHWTFVRRLDADGTLALGNPAPSWKFVGQSMDRDEFDRFGPWTMVWIELEAAARDAAARDEEDPMKIAQLEAQVTQLQQQVTDLQKQVEGLVQGLAHVADVIVPELAQEHLSAERRAELVAVAGSIRKQFVGAAPTPADS